MIIEAQERENRKDQIWGTTIRVEEVRETFKKFLKEFKLADRKFRDGLPITESDNKLFYIDYLENVNFSFSLRAI